MKWSDFYKEVRADLRKYDELGLLDEVSILRWVISELKNFGNNIMVFRDKIIYVNDKKSELPQGFFKLHGAFLCSDIKVSGGKRDELEPLLVNMWYEKGVKGIEWDTCDSCDKEYKESVVVEKIQFEDKTIDVLYGGIKPLRLMDKRFNEACAEKCLNFNIKSPYEFYIEGDYMWTNFDTGVVYLLFYGLPYTDDGELVIPDTPNGMLLQYLFSFVKKRVLEDVLLNDEMDSAQVLFQYYVADAREKKGLAMTDAKFARLSWDNFKTISDMNKLRIKQFEKMMPKL